MKNYETREAWRNPPNYREVDQRPTKWTGRSVGIGEMQGRTLFREINKTINEGELTYQEI